MGRSLTPESVSRDGWGTMSLPWGAYAFLRAGHREVNHNDMTEAAEAITWRLDRVLHGYGEPAHAILDRGAGPQLERHLTGGHGSTDWGVTPPAS